MNIEIEIKFKTARSGGKGGQNVNKVETMVEGYWDIGASIYFTAEQKNILFKKLSNKINAKGCLLIKSQTERTQLGNKEQVVKKIISIIAKALIVPKKRKATKMPKVVKEKILVDKKKKGETKQNRKKITL